MSRRRVNAAHISAETCLQVKKRRLSENTVPTRAAVPGQVLVCGQGDMGQLGLGDNDSMFERKRPAILLGFDNIVDVVAGGMHSILLSEDGKVYTFGCNDEGALGRDCSKEGSEFIPGKVDLLDKVVKISAGDSHSACLLENGSVYAWGSFRDSHGNMGLTLEGNKRIPVNLLPSEKCADIASGADHLVMLTLWGSVYTVGCGEQGQLGRVALRSASGEGRRGKTVLLQPLPILYPHVKGITHIWATNYCTFMLEPRKNVIFSFGLNNYKQALLAKKDEVVHYPCNTEIGDVLQIAGGQHHTIVLKNDGSCNVIGRCDYGRLGLGDIKEDLVELRPIEALRNCDVVKVECGEAQSFALTRAGNLYAWGMGSNLQLGTGSEDDVLEPVLIKSKQTENKHVLNVSSGGQHTLFLVKDKLMSAE